MSYTKAELDQITNPVFRLLKKIACALEEIQMNTDPGSGGGTTAAETIGDWEPFCAGGETWYSSERITVDSTGTVTTTKVYKLGATGVPTTTPPTATPILEGICEVECPTCRE